MNKECLYNQQIDAEIKSLSRIIQENLIIPDYQRPYRWTEENVRLLLQDVLESWKQGKKSYRIGSIILHEENGELNIVDGQQRITTIILLLMSLNCNAGNQLANQLTYNHIDSQNSIIINKQFIDRWIKENIPNEYKDYCNYLLEHCEFVEIRVTQLSEAFQMFDSQNGRGKELESYNLLKAYHIRAMEDDSFEEKIYCDQNWEQATRFQKQLEQRNSETFDILRQLFEEQLYRTRKWSRKNTVYRFDKKRISEFKGININKKNIVDFPFQNRELLQYATINYLNSIGLDIKGIKSRFTNINPENINSFVQINQNVVNGKNFFEYIESYVEIYKQIFVYSDEFTLVEFKSFYQEYCEKYHGSYRDGDRYLKELYKSLVFLMFDRFGEKGVNRYYKTLYALAYRLRLEKMQVRYNTVAEYPASYFYIINNAKSYSELQKLEKEAYQEIECRKEVECVLNFYFDQQIPVFTNNDKIDLTKYQRHNGNN